MNREKAKELWPIIKAFGEGKSVTWLRLNNKKVFDSSDDIILCDGGESYEISPESIIIYARKHDDGRVGVNFLTVDEVLYFENKQADEINIIKFVQDLDYNK